MAAPAMAIEKLLERITEAYLEPIRISAVEPF